MPNILICDDERDIVSALKIYLSDPDYMIFEAFDGQQAVRIISENEIHLVLLDIMMPVMDGITAMAAIREKSNVPVIFLTGDEDVKSETIGLNAGAADFIRKPFAAEVMLKRVHNTIELNRLHNDMAREIKL